MKAQVENWEIYKTLGLSSKYHKMETSIINNPSFAANK
jgi:hypothetical protein